MASGAISVAGTSIPPHSLGPAVICPLLPWDMSTTYHALLYTGPKTFLPPGLGLSDSWIATSAEANIVELEDQQRLSKYQLHLAMKGTYVYPATQPNPLPTAISPGASE